MTDLTIETTGTPTHVIDWSWWWVLSPLWISAGIVVLILAIVAAVAVVKTR